MKKTIVLIILVGGVIMAACEKKYPFSEKEKALINEGNTETPFRVLKITDKQDSILLRTPCEDICNFTDNPDFKLFIERLKTTLIIEDGVGIAASQVGILKKVFLFIRLDLPDEPVIVAINPKIINYPDTTVCFEGDGCLSIPDFSGNSVRYPWVEVEYYNEKGVLIRERLEGYSRLTGFNAVIFQHEYDHLQGVLFTDKLCE